MPPAAIQVQWATGRVWPNKKGGEGRPWRIVFPSPHGTRGPMAKHSRCCVIFIVGEMKHGTPRQDNQFVCLWGANIGGSESIS